VWKEEIKLDAGLASGCYETMSNAQTVQMNSQQPQQPHLPQPPPSSLQPPPLVLLVWADRPSSDAGNPSPWTCDWKDTIGKNRRVSKRHIQTRWPQSPQSANAGKLRVGVGGGGGVPNY